MQTSYNNNVGQTIIYNVTGKIMITFIEQVQQLIKSVFIYFSYAKNGIERSPYTYKNPDIIPL